MRREKHAFYLIVKRWPKVYLKVEPQELNKTDINGLFYAKNSSIANSLLWNVKLTPNYGSL